LVNKSDVSKYAVSESGRANREKVQANFDYKCFRSFPFSFHSKIADSDKVGKENSGRFVNKESFYRFNR